MACHKRSNFCHIALKSLQCLAVPYPAILICHPYSLRGTVLLKYFIFPVMSQSFSPRPLIMLISLAKLVYSCISKSHSSITNKCSNFVLFLYATHTDPARPYKFLQHPNGFNYITIYYFLFVLPSLRLGYRCLERTDISQSYLPLRYLP